MVEEELQLGHPAGPREGERREELLGREGAEGGDRRALLGHRLAAGDDGLAHTGPDRLFDERGIGGTLVPQQGHVPVEIQDRRGP